jgi:GT2 family glycosyltransferase
MELNDLTVIVVTYNSGHCIERLSAGLKNASNVIIVDNGSHDNTLAQIALFLPQARIEASASNLGFGAANNRALALVTTPFALLLNPDCEVSHQSLELLLTQAKQQPQAAMLVPQLMGARGKPTLNYGWVKHSWRSKSGVADGLCCVGYASGAAMLLNMTVTKPHGYFDESFFLYYEDDDLCLKYFNARLAIIVVPWVQVFHASRGSVKSGNLIKQEYWRGFHHAQSKLRITQKYEGLKQAKRLKTKKMFSASMAIVFRLLTLNPRLCARMVGRFIGMSQFLWGTK